MTTPATVDPPPLRRLPVPVAEPHPGLRLVAAGAPTVQPGQGVLDLPPAQRLSARDAAGEGDEDGLRGAADGEAPEGSDAGPGGTTGPGAGRGGAAATPCLPEPREWTARFVRAAVEVSAGLRPAAQIARWTTPDIAATLDRRGRVAANLRRRSGTGVQHRAAVRRVVACRPAAGVVELTAVVADHARVRAVAVRLEDVGGRWAVTALELG